MTRLAPNLFERRYRDLVEIGRSRLPSYAPAWTDYNAHDPGITFIELTAWVAEAQLYSLSTTRRDERTAYAALMGIEPHGSRPARGLIWPNPEDAAGPARLMSVGLVIERDSAIRLERSATPSFRAEHRQLYIPVRVEALTTRLADGTTIEHLEANRRGGPAFQPFGANEGLDAVLRMVLTASGHAPLFETDRPKDARLVIGVRSDAPRRAVRTSVPSVTKGRSPLEVALDVNGRRFVLPVVEDGTEGMLQTGAIVLDISEVDVAPMSATLEFRAPAGFARSPRIIRIEPNAVPIIQRLEKEDSYAGDGKPDQAFDLQSPGLEFEPGTDPVKVEVETLGKRESWSKVDRLDESGPSDRHFTLDPVASRIAFGNGLNGAAPKAGSKIVAKYSVCDGTAGNVAANRKWVVKGFGGLFGSNPDPTTGGDDRSGWLEQRREARQVVRDRHALVSARDFEEAAAALPGLEVGRTWMVPPSDADIATGTMRLVAMRLRRHDEDGASALESHRWLENVRRRLEPRVPLGSRLRVVAPQYVPFWIEAQIEAEPRKDPADVCRKVFEELVKRTTLVSDKAGDKVRPFGLPLNRRDLIAWIQKLPEVRRVLKLSLQGQLGTRDEVSLSRTGLPVFERYTSKVDVVRTDAVGEAA